jgi:hypothetical protein
MHLRSCARTVWLLALLFVVAQPGILSQTPAASAVPVKDSGAVALAVKAMHAMGDPATIAGITDSVALGTLTIHSPQGDFSAPTTIKTKGSQELRMESQWASGTSARIVNGGRGVIIKPDGTVKALILKNTFAERPHHIPLLSLLAEHASPNVEITSSGQSSVAGTAVDIISVSLPTSSDLPQAQFFRESTRRSFYIDHLTGLIAKIEYPLYPENGGPPAKVEIFYSDYRNASGVMVPFHQTTYLDGALQSDLVLTSVKFNAGLADSDFILPEVK